jgi:CRP-like cAMP-binding protein
MSNPASALCMFVSMSVDETKTAMNYFRVIEFKDGQVIFKAGDNGNSMYIVDEGKVSVLMGEREVAILTRGRPFGEMSVLDGRGRSATCRGSGTGTLLMLDDPALRRMMKNDPAMAAKVMHALASSLTSRLRRADQKLMEMFWTN